MLDQQPPRPESSEAAPPSKPTGGWRRRPGARALLAAIVLALVATGTYWLWQTNVADSDGDGLTNNVEVTGWLTQDGTVYRTDPYKADTDGDGLTDADEAGRLTTTGQAGDVYAGFSHPLLIDTDGDGLTDADEADLGHDPRDRDSDDDELGDGYEVDVVGSDPETADTDGDGYADGYEDANRDSKGLDPLWVDDEVSTLTDFDEFSQGFVAGELQPGDSLAWLAGNLASGAPLGVGALADLRDAIGSAMHGDWVGATFNAMSVVPLSDAVTIPRKVAAFLARNPRLAGDTARLIARAGPIPEAIKLLVARAVYPGWDQLVEAGASEKELLRLLKGQTNLDDLGKSLSRTNHVAGAATSPVSTRQRAEAVLRELLVSELKAAVKEGAKDLANAVVADVLTDVRETSSGCGEKCDGDVRVLDLVVDGIAHEVKAGYVPWSRSIERQIRKDAWLINTGAIEDAHWHFLPSSYSDTLGADPRVLELLDEVGITYTIHLPTGP